MSIANGQTADANDVLVGLTASGRIKFGSTNQTGAPVVSGVVTISQNISSITPESGLTDDIDTISSGATGVADVNGAVIVLSCGLLDADIVLKHNTGNIYTPYRRDVVLRSARTDDSSFAGNDWAILIRISSKWHVIATNALTPEQTLFNFQNFS